MKLTIRNKLIGGFSAVLLLMAIVAGIGGFAVFSLRRSANDATRIWGRLNAMALEIQVHNLEAQRRIKNYLTPTSAGSRDAYLEEAQFEIHEIQTLVEKAVSTAATAEMRTKFQKVGEALTRYEQAVGRAVETMKVGAAKDETNEALEAYSDAAEDLHEAAEDGEIAARDASQASLEDIQRTSNRSVGFVVVVSLLGMVFGIGLSYKLCRAILLPVEHMKEVAENVSMGNLDMVVNRYSDDEIGDLADSFSRMVTAVKFFRMEAEMNQQEAQPEEVVQ